MLDKPSRLSLASFATVGLTLVLGDHEVSVNVFSDRTACIRVDRFDVEAGQPKAAATRRDAG